MEDDGERDSGRTGMRLRARAQAHRPRLPSVNIACGSASGGGTEEYEENWEDWGRVRGGGFWRGWGDL